MENEEATYRSYLLRLWPARQNGVMVWRCSLEETRTGQRQAFADLDALVAFIRAEFVQKSALSEEEE